VNNRTLHHVMPDNWKRGGFTGGDRGERPSAALTCYNNRLTLAGLFLGQPPVLPLGLHVLLFGFAAEVGAVNFDRAGQDDVAASGADRLTNLVSHYERGFVLDIQIATKLKGRQTLDRVDEDGDRGQIIADR
jgi:hypothetical protein